MWVSSGEPTFTRAPKAFLCGNCVSLYGGKIVLFFLFWHKSIKKWVVLTYLTYYLDVPYEWEAHSTRAALRNSPGRCRCRALSSGLRYFSPGPASRVQRRAGSSGLWRSPASRSHCCVCFVFFFLFLLTSSQFAERGTLQKPRG